jgi:hypothetical protein
MPSEFDKKFVDRFGRQIDLKLDEDSLVLKAFHGSKLIGRMEFNSIECEHGEDLKITWMYLDLCNSTYLRSGIGRALIELMNEYHGGPLIAGNEHGTTSVDGSHLTGDAPSFIQKMKRDGLVRDAYGCDD